MMPNDWMAIADHLWQSTGFAAVAGLVALALRNHSARLRHWVWLAASCKFLVPFAALTAVGAAIGWRELPAATPSAVLAVIGQVSQSVASPRISSSVLTPQGSDTGSLWMLAGIVWALGFAGLAGSWWVHWRRLRAAVVAGSAVTIAAPIAARSSSTLMEPGVYGLFRPILLLPDGIFERLSPAQLQAVLAHEMCHVRHRDNLIAAIHMLVETTFWFHPLVWWIGRRMVAERERACDEEVLSRGGDPRSYAEGILSVCRFYVESPLACRSGVTGSKLDWRIRAILANRPVRPLSPMPQAALVLLGLAALLGPIAIGMANAPGVRAQENRGDVPRFEVASVRPCRNQAGRMRGSGESSPGRLNTGCDLLVDDNHLGLIQRAYVRFAGGHANPLGVIPVKGGPDWVRSQMFRIEAAADGQPSKEMMQGPMLQTLLEERFKLKIHREAREGRVYELQIAGRGARLKPFQEGACVQPPLTFPMPPLPAGKRYCQAMISLLGPAVNAEGRTLGEFSKLLNLVLDRPVIDRTGLDGRYDIHLEFSPDETTPGLRVPLPEPSPAAPRPRGPAIFVALQEQLGLKLVPAKGPVEALVIDHIEKPSAN